MASKKLHKCPFCNTKYTRPYDLYGHIENKHKRVSQGLPGIQIVFNKRNRYPVTKSHGVCVISGQPTRFNINKGRYERFHGPAEAKIYSQNFKGKMREIHGVEHKLNDPEIQKKMLAARRISGSYSYKGSKITYTGSYEKDFLEYMDRTVRWNKKDLVMPAPVTFKYTWGGKERFYMPDVYIPSLKLFIEIKASDNTGWRADNLDREKLKDRSMSGMNYIKVFDKNYSLLNEVLKIENH